MRKQVNGNMTRSEESIILMTPYRFPHHGNRSFTDATDDVLPSAVILSRGKRISCEKDGKQQYDTERRIYLLL